MSNQSRLSGIPKPSLRRLPSYHNYLKKLAEQHIEYVSCTQIAVALNQVPIQIRKDLVGDGTGRRDVFELRN